MLIPRNYLFLTKIFFYINTNFSKIMGFQKMKVYFVGKMILHNLTVSKFLNTNKLMSNNFICSDFFSQKN